MSLFTADYSALVLIFVVFTTAIYRLWTSSYTYWRDRNVPYIKPSFPFGSTASIILQTKFIGEIFKDMYFQLEGHKFGGYISMRKPGIIVRDPEMIKTVLTKDFHHFMDRGVGAADEKRDPLSAHLFNLAGDKWKIIRSKLSPTFTSGKMKLMFNLMKTCGQELQKSLSDHAERGDVIEVKDFMARYGTDVIGSCAFGLDIDSINNPDCEFRKISSDIFIPNLPYVLFNLLTSIIPGIGRLINVKVTPKAREDFFFKIVGDAVTYREKNNIRRHDFLDLLIQIKNKGFVEDETNYSKENEHNNKNKEVAGNTINEIEFTNELMAAQCFVFFAAGFETSSTTLSFCLYELALNKDIYYKLQEEIDQVIKKYDGDLSYTALKEMTYMDTVVQETLRKYPTLSILIRECVKEYKLPNLTIEKGTRILIPLYGLHYDPKYYPDPDHFDPDRFSEEAKQARHHYSYLPFGEGPRICIGMRFGILQVKTGLAILLSKFNFDRVQETQVPIEFSKSSFTALPKNGIKLMITKRIK